MSDPAEHAHHLSENLDRPLSPLMWTRSVIGGVLMGLANLVPGISGGTMLLAAGVYPDFVDSIARLTRFEFKTRPIIVLGTIAFSAALAIGLLAGTMKSLVIEERWMMYSLFIGLTLGGVPLVWRLARPASTATWIGAGAAFVLMVLMAAGASTGAREASMFLLFMSGLAGASAMILPGVSGGYLLLLLGQYEPILGAVDGLKQGLLGHDGQGLDMALVTSSLETVIPVGLGVVVGIVSVSNLLRWLMDRYEAATLGVLLGLLLGAVVGLYPFQAPAEPELGFMHHGRVLEADELAEVDPKYWPLARFNPSSGQIASSVGLVVVGFAATLAVARLGRDDDEEEESESQGQAPG